MNNIESEAILNEEFFKSIGGKTDQVEARVEHLEKIRSIVGNAYPNKFERSKISGDEDTITNLVGFEPVQEIVKELKDNTPEGAKPDQELKAKLNEKLKAFGNVRISGRLAVPPRVMGKAAFVHLSDGKNRLQIYVRKDDAKAIENMSVPSASAGGQNANESELNPEPPANAGGTDLSGWALFGLLDHGDFIGVEGFLFLTNTGELSVHVETIQFLSKALLPMPDKMHGIADPELQRRYRYADLIASSLQIEHEGLTTREVFERRAKLISGMRRFLDDHGYIEVETPMLTPKATGAAATPFETYHRALDIPLYARIAPELYLKRLTVGGFEKVYELNRNFRNEGLSHKHNPEFTMLEFYCAYMDVNGMMDFAEAMLITTIEQVIGTTKISVFNPATYFDGKEYHEGKTHIIDLSNFRRWTMKKAISECSYWKSGKFARLEINEEWLSNSRNIKWYYYFVNEWNKNGLRNFHLTARTDNPTLAPKEYEKAMNETFEFATKAIENSREYDENVAVRELIYLFEELAEKNLIQPTFIIDYPKSISPLSKASPENPQIAERFELFINGMEVANGFSELNDPQEQYERFKDQMKERESGDHEAMVMDEDYIRALAYGMPPAAGIGIGIDRLVMLLTNRHSIRDVILFPHMRPVLKEEEKGNEGEVEN